MKSLYFKELHTLAPMLALGVFLISGDFLTRPFTERLDEATYSSVASIDPGEGGFIGFIQLLLGFIVAYAAFPREHDERTIELLYALPVSRPRIFFSKVLAGLSVLVTICVVGQITNALLVWPNPSSFEGTQVTFSVAARVALLHSMTAAVGYGHGLLGSVLRRFGALPYVFLGYAVSVVVELVPALEWIDPVRLSRTEYVGSALLVPVWPALGHLALAALAAALSYLFWMGSFERFRAAVAERTAATTLAFGCVTTIAVVAGFVVVGFIALRERGNVPPPDPDAVPEATGIAFHTASARTGHYEFVYPENLRSSALELVGRSDAILEAATATVGAAHAPNITVDLAESSSHHEGIAASARIRMGLAGQSSWRLAHVLAHESTHVLQNQESDLHLGEYGGTMRFFIEGSAEWVAFEVALSEALGLTTEGERREERELRAASRIVAAASAERHDVRFEEILDEAAFRMRLDTVLAYPLGEVLSEAVARGCGDAAVGDLMRSFARTSAPQNTTGEALLRDALGAGGCDLERVIDAWDAILSETLETERARVDAIPRMSGGLVEASADMLTIEATLDRAPLPVETYSLRYRAYERADDVEVRGAAGHVVEGSTPRRVRFRIPRAEAPGTRFEILFSLDVDARAFPFSERWQTLSVP